MWQALVCYFGFGAKAGAFPAPYMAAQAHPVAPAPASAAFRGF